MCFCWIRFYTFSSHQAFGHIDMSIHITQSNRLLITFLSSQPYTGQAKSSQMRSNPTAKGISLDVNPTIWRIICVWFGDAKLNLSIEGDTSPMISCFILIRLHQLWFICSKDSTALWASRETPVPFMKPGYNTLKYHALSTVTLNLPHVGWVESHKKSRWVFLYAAERNCYEIPSEILSGYGYVSNQFSPLFRVGVWLPIMHV